MPIRDHASAYLTRHGPGYSEFEHTSRGIALHLHQTVAAGRPGQDFSPPAAQPDRSPAPSLGDRLCRMGAGDVRDRSRRCRSSPNATPRTGALLARNPWNVDFGKRVAFADFGAGETSTTCDRAEFLGRHRSVDQPAALQRNRKLSGAVGAGIDPCAAIQRNVVIGPQQEVEVTFLLGQGRDEQEAVALIERYRGINPGAVKAAVATRWNDILGALRVKTPDRSFDLMINQWLLYQTLACRVLARTAFYQAGGAFGFRDQLQDVMALVVPMRDVAREHLLRAAAHQFEEGDALHWWHEPSGKGVRTRISDDYLWLPYAVAHYLDVTGDESLLDENGALPARHQTGTGRGRGVLHPRVSSAGRNDLRPLPAGARPRLRHAG